MRQRTLLLNFTSKKIVIFLLHAKQNDPFRGFSFVKDQQQRLAGPSSTWRINNTGDCIRPICHGRKFSFQSAIENNFVFTNATKLKYFVVRGWSRRQRRCQDRIYSRNSSKFEF